MSISAFLEENFRHFNARETLDAARAYRAHMDDGGKMVLAMAGAMSTAELGISLAKMIRAGKVHAVSATAANLEEDLSIWSATTTTKSCPTIVSSRSPTSRICVIGD